MYCRKVVYIKRKNVELGYSTYKNRDICWFTCVCCRTFCLLDNRTSPQSSAMYRWLLDCIDAVVSLCIWRVLVHMHDEVEGFTRCCDATRKHMQAHALLRLTENAGVDLWGERLLSTLEPSGVLH